MILLRWIFVTAVLGCAILVAWNGRWEGRLTQSNYTWIIDLDRSPVWAPPAHPSYGAFKKHFDNSDKLPAEHAPGIAIERVLKIHWMAVDLLLYLWPVTFILGLMYLAVRQGRRDLLLHVGLFVGIGLTAAVGTCIQFWLVLGGWGPPNPEFFGSLGLVGGLISGLICYILGSPNQPN